MAQLTELRFARPDLLRTHVGATTSQCDRAQRSNIARNLFDVDGRNVRVPIMTSDSVVSQDLPAAV
jgi:hypothetical protein